MTTLHITLRSPTLNHDSLNAAVDMLHKHGTFSHQMGNDLLTEFTLCQSHINIMVELKPSSYLEISRLVMHLEHDRIQTQNPIIEEVQTQMLEFLVRYSYMCSHAFNALKHFAKPPSENKSLALKEMCSGILDRINFIRQNVASGDHLAMMTGFAKSPYNSEPADNH
jgi:hypothetical protein